MKTWWLLPLSLLIVLGLLLSGCSSTGPGPATPQASNGTPGSPAPPAPGSTAPIKIGALISLTGGSANSGAGEKIALQYRLDQIGWKVAGRPIQLIIDDDASSPTTAVTSAKKQLLLDKVDVILGPTQGGAAIAAANFMKTADPPIPIFIIMPKSASLLENVRGNNVYLPMGTDAANGYYWGRYAAEKLKYKAVSLMGEDVVSANDKLEKGFLKAVQKQGGRSVQQQWIRSGAVDFSANIAALKPADCIAFWFTTGMASRFMTQYFSSGKKMPLLVGDSGFLPSHVLTPLGDKAVGIIAETLYTPLIDTPMNQAYVADYMKKTGTTPMVQSAAIDQALLVYLAAVKATNGDTSPAKINEAIHKLKVDTPVGTIAFTPQGMGIGDMYIVESVKVADRIDWKPVLRYSQILLDMPEQGTPTAAAK